MIHPSSQCPTGWVSPAVLLWHVTFSLLSRYHKAGNEVQDTSGSGWKWEWGGGDSTKGRDSAGCGFACLPRSSQSPLKSLGHTAIRRRPNKPSQMFPLPICNMKPQLVLGLERVAHVQEGGCPHILNLASHSLPMKLGSPSMLEVLGRATQFSELDQNVATLRRGPVSWDADRRCN